MNSPIVSSKNWLLDPLQLGRISKIIETRSGRFDELVRLSELDPGRDFVGANLDCIDFGESDLRGFDFSDCSCRYSDFSRANTCNTVFLRTNVWRAKVSGEQIRQIKGIAENSDSVELVFDLADRKKAAELVRGIIRNTGMPVSLFADLAHLDRRTVSRFLGGSRVSTETVLTIVKTARMIIDKDFIDNISMKDGPFEYERVAGRVISNKYLTKRGPVYKISDSEQMELFTILNEMSQRS